jgi:hypothetical protein
MASEATWLEHTTSRVLENVSQPIESTASYMRIGVAGYLALNVLIRTRSGVLRGAFGNPNRQEGCAP